MTGPGAMSAGIFAAWGIAAMFGRKFRLVSTPFRSKLIVVVIFVAEVIVTLAAWIGLLCVTDIGWK
jgi:hypothetical protein